MVSEIDKNCSICKHNKHFKGAALQTSGCYKSNHPFTKITIDLNGQFLHKVLTYLPTVVHFTF